MNILRNPQSMIKLLIATSLIMFVSLFTGIPKVAGVTLTIWVLNIGWIMHLLIGNVTLSDLVEGNENKLNQAKADKNYVEVSVRLLLVSLVVIGLIIAGMNIVYLFFM